VLLLNFLLARARKDPPGTNTYTAEERQAIEIVDNKLYRHARLRINYDTYDVRRGQDTITPSSRPDCMFLDPEPEEGGDFDPYFYGRVIYIFHAQVKYHTPGMPAGHRPPAHRVDMCYMRWFVRDREAMGGFGDKRLPMLGFLPADHEAAFGFIHPRQIVRASHLIPAFAFGRFKANTIGTLGPSDVRQVPADAEAGRDYQRYYLNL
jgi:hypothetical protein